jgi:hypothetical protein
MDMYHDGPRHLRERPPSWPRHNDGEDSQPRRWEREPEPFEDDALPELYPGALVMEDMSVTEDEVGTLRILARYTVARLLLLSLAGALTHARLRSERQIALEHLALLPDYDWERRALERVAMLCRQSPAPALVEAATLAAEAAAKRSQIMGAFSLYRTAYELALAEKWWAEAAQVARGIAQLARLEEAHYSIRLWRRRAAILERRAVREAAAAADIEARAAAAAAETEARAADAAAAETEASADAAAAETEARAADAVEDPTSPAEHEGS